MAEQIHYLKQEEKQNTRGMYESVFAEDSGEFVDYYYQWKIRDNRILVMEDEAGYEVMIHFNPYQLKIKGKCVEVPYIVAVATRADSRRKGKMQQVMERALQDLQKAHCPFTFLLPANPAYYYGQGFVYVPKLPLKKEKVQKTRAMQNIQNEIHFSVKRLEMEQVEEITKTANQILEQQYDVYVRRDAAYYERLQAETASENGAVLVVEAMEKVIGILSYGKEEQAEIKEFLLIQQYEHQKEEICNQVFGEGGWREEGMQMMFRITDLQALSGMLKGEPETWTVQVRDSFVEKNNGIWKIEWNLQGGSVSQLDTESTKEKQTRKMTVVDIAKITEKVTENWKVFIQEWV